MPSYVDRVRLSSTMGGQSSTAAAVPLPSWTVGARDKILIAISLDDASRTVTTPTGYSLLLGPTVAATGQEPKLYVFVKDAVSGDSGATVNITISAGSGAWSLTGRIYAGVGGIDASAIVGAGATPVSSLGAPTLTLAENDDLEVVFVAWTSQNGIGSASATNPSGWTHAESVSPIQAPYVATYSYDRANSGTTEDAATETWTGDTVYAVSVRIALYARPTFVQEVANSVDSSSSLTLTLPSNATAGDTVMVTLEYTNTSSPTVSVSGLGATWTKLFEQDMGFGHGCEVWKGEGVTGGSATITATATASLSGWAGHAAEFSGVKFVDTLTGGLANSTTAITHAETLAVDDIAYGQFTWDNSIRTATYTDSPGAWVTLTQATQTSQGARLQVGYRVATGSESATRRATFTSTLDIAYASLRLSATAAAPVALTGTSSRSRTASASIVVATRLTGTGARSRTATATATVRIRLTGTSTRQRGATAALGLTIPTAGPFGLGNEINGRSRDGYGILTISVDPDTFDDNLPTLVQHWNDPVVIDGWPYADVDRNPWVPTSTVHGTWGRPHIVIGGVNVTWFRRDRKGRKVRTVVGRWTDKSPGGDDLLDLYFPAVTGLDVPGTGDLAWLKTDEVVTMKVRRPDGSLDIAYEGVVGPLEDARRDAANGSTVWGLTVHCFGAWADLDRFITLPRPSIDEYIDPIPVGHLTPVDSAQFIYAHVHRARLYGWPFKMKRPDDSGIRTGEQGNYGDPIGSQTIQTQLALMQTSGSFYTIRNERPRQLVLDTIRWDLTSFDFRLRAAAPGVTYNLVLDPTTAYNAIYGHGQAPWGPVDQAIGRPDALADWCNWQYPFANLVPPDYPLPSGEDFVAGDGHGGFDPFSDELKTHGYDLDSGSTYLSSDFDLIERFQTDSGIQVDGIVGPQTWAQAFIVGINTKALAQAYIKEIVTGTRENPFRTNARGGITGPNPDFDPDGHPRRETLEQFGSIRKALAVRSAGKEWDRIHKPIYRGTVSATNLDPPEMCALDTRAGMTMLLKDHAGEDRLLFVAQVERQLGMDRQNGARTVTWTVSEQPEGLMTLAARILRKQGIRDLVAQNRPPRHHAKEIPNFPIFDAESGAGLFPKGQGQTGGLWTKFLIPMGGQADINAVKIVADRPAKIAAVVFANPYLTVAQLIALPGLADPSVGTADPWAVNADKLSDMGVCWATGNPTAMQGYWPHDPGTTLTGVLADLASWPFRANSTYAALFVWTDRDCKVAGDPTTGYRAFFPEPVG